MQGNIAFKIPALNGNIVRPESVINSLNQVIAVNWITSSEKKMKKKLNLEKKFKDVIIGKKLLVTY